MKLSYHWLQRYVDIDLSPGELCQRLTVRGLEVEGYDVAADDFVIEIEIKANRPDLLSHIGVAREIAAMTGSTLRLPEVRLAESGEPAAKLTSVQLVDPDLCPRYTARLVRNVKIAPSPAWLQKCLEALGLRPVNNVVDLTNFVLMECGQPLHAFDFDKLLERRIVVRRARPGERLIMIDQTQKELSDEMLVIADARRAVAVAGVMGGFETEVDHSTKHVLLESAYFQPNRIRRTSRALALPTDASYRFERGVDPEAVEWASRRCAALIAETAGGSVAPGVVDVNHLPRWQRRVSVRLPRIRRVLGMDVPGQEVKRLMASIGFHALGESDGAIQFSVPSYRGDVAIEIDLIEEVARLHGYERIPDRSALPIQVGRLPRWEQVRQLVRTLLASMGYTEVTCSSLVSVKRAEQPSIWAGPGAVTLADPLNPEEAAMRRMLLPSLLDVKRTNQDGGVMRTEIFEIARVYVRPELQPLPQEITCVAILEEDSFYELKGTIETLLERLGLADHWQLEPAAAPMFQDGTCVRLTLGGELLGCLGRMAPETAAEHELRQAPFACELNFDLLVEKAELERKFTPLPKYPAIDRDLAIVVDEAVLWADVLSCVRETAGELLERVEFFDLYRGKQVPAGKKSLAFSLRFRSPERTLRHEEVDAVQERTVTALRDRLGATLRS